MKLIDLSPFAAKQGERHSITKPRVVNQHVVATDGRILIRCLKELAVDPGEPPEGKFPNWEPALQDLDSQDMHWCRVNLGGHCTFCRDTLVLRIDSCKFCHGSKGHRCECGTEHDCGYCDGTGMEPGDRCPHCIQLFRGRRLDRAYLKLIHSLPDAVIGAIGLVPAKPVFFRFTGGAGCLMGIAE